MGPVSTDALQPKRIPPRRRSEGRRVTPERLAAILDAAQEICLSDGYSAVTVQALATRTGYVRPVIYDCYGTADNVIVHVAERATQTVTEETSALTRTLEDASHAGKNSIAAVLDALTTSIYTHPDAWRLVAMPSNNAPEPAQHTIALARNNLREVVHTALACSLDPLPGPAADTDAITFLLEGIIDAFVTRVCTDPLAYPADRTRSFIESLAASTRFTA
ncbi:transcriptional regulator [Mycobacteroides abscessus subsp. bolletii]|nr:transcriptional regulator [Mycobacteroides abscessus subsp. bolletii]SLF40644.1 transcriptional regulator [Mycobacteroides abscessus subsp. bolletii]